MNRPVVIDLVLVKPYCHIPVQSLRAVIPIHRRQEHVIVFTREDPLLRQQMERNEKRVTAMPLVVLELRLGQGRPEPTR